MVLYANPLTPTVAIRAQLQSILRQTGLSRHLKFLTSGHPDAQPWASECPDVKNFKWRLNQIWHRMLYSCIGMETVGVKGLKNSANSIHLFAPLPLRQCGHTYIHTRIHITYIHTYIQKNESPQQRGTWRNPWFCYEVPAASALFRRLLFASMQAVNSFGRAIIVDNMRHVTYLHIALL